MFSKEGVRFVRAITRKAVVNLPARVCVWKKTLQAAVEDMTDGLQQP